jgi:hypothetical protein
MRNIYIASSWKNRYDLRPIRDRIESMGHKVIARWIDVDVEDYGPEIGAQRDLDDLSLCDTLVFWPDNSTHKTSGKYVEFGFALGLGHEIFLVEPESCTCIFTKLTWPWITRIPKFDDLYEALDKPLED